MKSHLMMPAGLFAMLLTAAMSTGSTLLFVLALMVALTVFVCLISFIEKSLLQIVHICICFIICILCNFNFML